MADLILLYNATKRFLTRIIYWCCFRQNEHTRRTRISVRKDLAGVYLLEFFTTISIPLLSLFMQVSKQQQWCLTAMAVNPRPTV